MDADVVIVGAGLAGSATATHLARRGARIMLVDKARFPREKPCGEGLLPRGTELLSELGLPSLLDDMKAPTFTGILYRAYGVSAHGDFAGGQVGRGVRRSVLDARVQDAALTAGEVALLHETVVDVEPGPAVRLRSGRTLRARVVVGADGPRSRVRHAVGLDLGPPRHGRYALRQHFALSSGQSLPERVEVNAIAGCELYLTPSAPGVVGLACLVEHGVMQRGHGDKVARIQALLKNAPAALRERLRGAEPVTEALACGPLRVRTDRVSRGRVVLVGDAAGYVDAITGEGMSLALATAKMASDAIEEVLSGAPPEHAFATYARARKRLFNDHLALTLGLIWLVRHPRVARRSIARLAREPEIFTRLLAVNNGTARLADMGIGSALKLALGTAPRAKLAS